MTSRVPTLIGLCFSVAAGVLGPIGCESEPDELCLGDPCVITGTHVVDPFSQIDFEDRDVVLSGTLDIDSGSVTILAGSFRMTPTGTILTSPLGPSGGSIEIEVIRDITIEGTSGAAIDVRGAPGGAITLTATDGSISSGRALRAAGLAGGPVGGEILLTAGFDVSIENVLDAQAGSFAGSAGSIRIDAGRDVRVTSVDIDGGTEGSGVFEAVAGGSARIGPVDARGAGSGGLGGEITIDALGSVSLEGPIAAQGAGTAGGEGGIVTLFSGTGELLEVLATVRVDGVGIGNCAGSFSADGGTVVIAANIDADGECAGSIDLVATDELRVEAGSLVQARSGNLSSGSFAAQSRGPIFLAGTIQVDGGGLGGGDGGTLRILGDGAVTVAGQLTADARNSLSTAGAIELFGCRIDVLPAARLEADGDLGTIDVFISREAVLSGTFTAGTEIALAHADEVPPPQIAGASFSPAPTIVPSDTLTPCSCADHDRDGDAVADECDNCSEVFNPSQVDADANGIGNACDCDFDGDGQCTGSDLALWAGDFELRRDSGLGTDLNDDGVVNVVDYFFLLTGLARGEPGPGATVP